MELASSQGRYITKLGAHYSVYQQAVYKLLKDWVDGKPDTHPVRMTEKNKANILSHCNKTLRGTNSVEDIWHVSNKLVQLGVIDHFNTVTTHRQWVVRSFQVLRASGVKFSDTKKMATLTEIHDLSKYTPDEVLGYTLKFCNGNGSQELDDPDEIQEWEMSLKSHFASNPHHPQYFRRDTEKGQVDVMYQQNGRTFLEEGTLDMLACRGERDMKYDEEFSLSKWLSIPSKFLGRYSDADRKWVSQKLEEWMKVVLEFNADYCDYQINRILTEDSGVRMVVS